MLDQMTRREQVSAEAVKGELEAGMLLTVNTLAKRKKWSWRRAKKAILHAVELGWAKRVDGGWIQTTKS